MIETATGAPAILSDAVIYLEAAGERRAVRAALTGRKVAYIGGIAAAATRAARPSRTGPLSQSTTTVATPSAARSP